MINLESSEKLLFALLITAIPKNDYTDFPLVPTTFNRCNRFKTVVTREFYAFPEISFEGGSPGLIPIEFPWIPKKNG